MSTHVNPITKIINFLLKQLSNLSFQEMDGIANIETLKASHKPETDNKNSNSQSNSI